jgi:urease accessory protein
MLKLIEKLNETVNFSATLTLPFDQRQKSRLRAKLDNGEEVGLMLPRGSVLRGGDCLCAEDGTVIQVQAAAESVTTAKTQNPTLLARACYHLGNRHIPLQVGNQWLRYLHDHVLDEMVEKLGLSVCHEAAPFEPEGGAYGGGGHHHSHEHSHDESHEHKHSHQ